MNFTFYDYLEIAPGSSAARIDAAYAHILERFGYGHTEAGQDLSGLVRKIHAAYEVLSDPAKRERYDAELQREARAADRELKEALDRKFERPHRIVQEVPVALRGNVDTLAA